MSLFHVPLGEFQVVEIPGGLAGTQATIEAMRHKAVECSRHRRLVELARWIVEEVDRKDGDAEAEALFDWVREHVRYVKDPVGLEYVTGACDTIFVVAQGDCDDHAVVMAALAMALGHRAAFRTVAADPTRPAEASHVYAMILTPEGWKAADTAEGDYFGWEPPGTSNPVDYLVL